MQLYLIVFTDTWTGCWSMFSTYFSWSPSQRRDTFSSFIIYYLSTFYALHAPVLLSKMNCSWSKGYTFYLLDGNLQYGYYVIFFTGNLEIISMSADTKDKPFDFPNGPDSIKCIGRIVGFNKWLFTGLEHIGWLHSILTAIPATVP